MTLEELARSNRKLSEKAQSKKQCIKPKEEKKKEVPKLKLEDLIKSKFK